MNGNGSETHRHLPRLAEESYQGPAVVHWTMAMENRATGWLDQLSHASIRELLLHAACSYHVTFPSYCLMPDHLHLLIAGLHPEADQKKAVTFLRRHLNGLLKRRGDVELQKQAYDHVLTRPERERDAFRKIAFYILENPVRRRLSEGADRWPFSGCVVAGHPAWDVFHEEYWNSFWKLYQEKWERTDP